MESMSDTENDMPSSRISDGGKYLSGTGTWEEDIPALDLEKLDVKSFNDALRRSSQVQHFEKSSGYLPTARNSTSMSEDDILQKINVSKILGDDDVDSGDITFDMLIPTDKVGLVIGKGGKNIKALQEKSGARMNVIQHSNTYDEYDKTLRMVGPPDLVQHARYLVFELINRTPDANTSKYSTNANEGYRQSQSGSVTSNMSTIRYPVPKISVGLIIGRGGETIKKIRSETGAKVQFDPVNNNLEDLDEQVATVTGKPDQIRAACQMIQELVRTALKGFRQKSSKGFYEEPPSKNYIHSDSKHKITSNSRPIIKKHISVPADKASIFEIQTNLLDEISSQTGVYCCIDPGDVGLTCEASETVFILKGHPRQVDIATELIMKKVRNGQGQQQYYIKSNKHYQRPQDLSRDSEPKNTEWGQGDPSAPWSMQNPTSSRSQDSGKSSYSFSHSQWLEYFQPERQQAQAHEWEQKVKAELDSSIPKPASVPTTEKPSVSGSPQTPPDEESQEPLLSKLQPVTEQWSESAPDCPESVDESEAKEEIKMEESVVSEALPEDLASANSGTERSPPFPFPPQGLPQFGPSTRVVTLYYDINSNSVVVLNQWNYT